MIDIHSHIIYDIDDGAKSIEESLDIIREAYKLKFTDIILTPHYIENYYVATPQEINEKKYELQNSINKENIDIKIHSGNEIYISLEINDLIEENKILKLANSRYVLIELPMNSNVKYFDNLIFKLRESNLIPIMAHPERYKCVQNNLSFIEDYINNGGLVQSNYASILGYYGKSAKNTVKKLLENDYVHFLATDCHRPNTIYAMLPKAIKKIKKIISEKKFLELSRNKCTKNFK